MIPIPPHRPPPLISPPNTPERHLREGVGADGGTKLAEGR